MAAGKAAKEKTASNTENVNVVLDPSITYTHLFCKKGQNLTRHALFYCICKRFNLLFSIAGHFKAGNKNEIRRNFCTSVLMAQTLNQM